MSDSKTRVFCPSCFKSYPSGTAKCPEDGTELMGLPQEASLEGTVLDGKYEVNSLLGRGGMGTVYKATQKLIEREVALKILRTDFTSDMNAVKRFFREAKAVAQLRSPHAVILYDFGLAREGHLYYTMELVKGRPLSQELSDGKPLPTKRAVRIMLHVARALEEAHGFGIVHRDLKPSNIMLVGTGDNEVAKVLDFGIAKLVTTPEGSTMLTDSGMAVGTPKYMSPEQAIGGHVDYRSDMYSMGVIFYELLAGLHPFHGGTPSVMMHQHVHEEPVPVRIMAPEVEIPVPVERLLNRLLTKRPGDRPRRITEVTSELAALIDGSYDPNTTRMPRMATSPPGLRQIVDEEISDDFRIVVVDPGGLEAAKDETNPGPGGEAPKGRTKTSEGLPATVGRPEMDRDDEESEGTEDYTEGTGDFPGTGDGDPTPLYQKALSPDGSKKGKEAWRDEDYIPMDGKDEWTTTSKHIPQVYSEETDPPGVEWDAPAPDWENPPPVWEESDLGEALPSRRRSHTRLVLMVLLVAVAVLAAALHYQLLDSLVERFGLTAGPASQDEPGPAARAPTFEDQSGPVSGERPSSDPLPEPAPGSDPVPSVDSPKVEDGAADPARVDEIRRRGVRAAAVGDFEAAIVLFERSLDLGGNPADLDQLIDECRRKLAEQRQ